MSASTEQLLEVQDGSHTSSSHHTKYRRDIDGLRAIAVLAVVGFHAAPGRIPSGFIGVDIFFVISGYLISTIIFSSLETESFSIIDFYRRRVRRIFPALLIVLSMTLLAGYYTFTDEQLETLAKHVSGGAIFSSNLILWSESGYFDNAADYKPLLHLWSLGIEEQFYIAWPFVLLISWKYKFNLLGVISTLLFTSFGLSIYQAINEPVAAFYSLLPRAWELLVGAMLACVKFGDENKGRYNGERYSDIFSLAGLVLLFFGFYLVNKDSNFPGWWALPPTIGAACVIWAGPNSWINKNILSFKPLVWIGLISFPLYLWHWPLLSFLRIMEGAEVAQWKRGAAVALSFALAWLTYRFVEKPIRNSSASMFPPAILAILMATLGAIAFNGYFAKGFANRSIAPREVNAGEIGHLDFFNHIKSHSYACTPEHIYLAAGSWNGFVRCFQSIDQKKIDIAIVGDSHAEHLFPGLAAKIPSKNIVFYGKAGAPFTNNPEFKDIFTSILEDRNIKAVILAAKWAEKTKEYATDEWSKNLEQTIQALSNSGKIIYLIDDVPIFSFLPDRCKYDGRLGIISKCGEQDAQEEIGYEKILKKSASKPDRLGVRLLEIRGLFCQHDVCSMARDGLLLFRDQHHLNIYGSKLVAEKIKSSIEIE